MTRPCRSYKGIALPSRHLLSRLIPTVALVLAGVSLSVTHTDPFLATTPTAAAQTGQHWMIGQGMLPPLAKTSPATTSWFYNTPNAFSINTAMAGYSTNTVMDFTSYATFQSQVATIPAGTWVQYDNEAWTKTPLNEQQNPALYMREFATLAHQHNLLVSETPAMDLVNVAGSVCSKQSGETMAHAYLRCQIPADAQYANMFDIQAQSEQGSVTAYSGLVHEAAKQFHSANPSGVVLAGLTTDRGASATVLFNCWRAVNGAVGGFWLNTQTATLPVAAAALTQIQAASAKTGL